jgi:hypothetical protein
MVAAIWAYTGVCVVAICQAVLGGLLRSDAAVQSTASADPNKMVCTLDGDGLEAPSASRCLSGCEPAIQPASVSRLSKTVKKSQSFC